MDKLISRTVSAEGYFENKIKEFLRCTTEESRKKICDDIKRYIGAKNLNDKEIDFLLNKLTGKTDIKLNESIEEFTKFVREIKKK